MQAAMPHAIGTWPTRAHRPAVVTARRMARVFTRLPARRDRSFGRLGAVSEPRLIPDDPYANPPAVPKQFAKLLDTVKAGKHPAEAMKRAKAKAKKAAKKAAAAVEEDVVVAEEAIVAEEDAEEDWEEEEEDSDEEEEWEDDEDEDDEFADIIFAARLENALRVAPVTLSGVPFIDFDQLEAPKELARRRERATLEKIAETAEEKEKEKADRLEQLAREEQEAEAEARARKEAIAEAKAHANEAKALAEAEALAELEKLEREEAEAEAEAQRRRDAIAAEKDRAEAEAKAELERLAREEQEAIAEAKRRAEAEALASVASVPPDVDVAPTPMMLRRNAKIGLARLKRLEEEDEQTPEPEDDDAGEEVEKSEVALSEAVQKKELATERGVPFSSEGAFYRAESAQARDLATLLASTLRRPRVLDALAGGGARTARYLLQGGASHVHANDASAEAFDALLETVDAVSSLLDGKTKGAKDKGTRPSVSLTCEDARKVMANFYVRGEHFDLVDVDSFGAENFLDDALRVVKPGGYVYATSTDALGLCGNNPASLFQNYSGAFVSPNVPGVNETALRVLAADAIRRGACAGLRLTPAFSLFHPHGPVFRVMLKAEAMDTKDGWTGEGIGYVAHCRRCGASEAVRGDVAEALLGDEKEGAASPLALGCRCEACAEGRDGGERVRSPLAVSGPMWLGPLHDLAHVRGLLAVAETKAWVHDEAKEKPAKGQRNLREVLAALEEESDPNLPPWFYRTDELARKDDEAADDEGGFVQLEGPIPALDAWIDELKNRGFAACRSHVDTRGIKTNATRNDAVEAANAVNDGRAGTMAKKANKANKKANKAEAKA